MSQASSAERYFLTLVNQERARHGLDPLVLETRLNDSAADHSLWMLQTDIFSHTGAGGSRVRDRVEAAGFPLEVSWRVSENLAYISDNGNGSLLDEVRQMHINLMNSPGHRANILDPDVTYLGVGLEVGTFNGHRIVMATQNFARTLGQVELDAAPGITIGTVTAPMTNAPAPSQAQWLAEVGPPARGLNGTPGHDLILRGSGNETVSGGAGSDWIAGGAGNDVLRSGTGNDILLGQAGNDRLYGDGGADRLWGGAGHDTLYGGMGNDILSGDLGRDRLFGGAGNDRLFGGPGDDLLNGGDGNDTLVGGSGNDTLTGGAGADHFVFAASIGIDRITDFQPDRDRILISKDLVGADVTAFVADRIRETEGGMVIDLSPGNKIILADPDLTRQDVADDIFLFG
ncbi:MAG: hypothetical protein FJX25_03280 [Alphaproteobacteria bacterium]|nr:hypothetical protein [Alphaproteobacteria bacterium]